MKKQKKTNVKKVIKKKNKNKNQNKTIKKKETKKKTTNNKKTNKLKKKLGEKMMNNFITLPEDNTPSILNGDVIECLKRIPDGSISCIITSPPYWGQRDYEEEGQIGTEEKPEGYIDKMLQVADELKRVLSEDGSYFLNVGDKYVNKNLQMIPFKLAIKMQERGWILRNVVIWHKPNHMPSSIKDRFGNTWEPIFFFVKDTNNYLPPSYHFDLDTIRIEYKTDSKNEEYNLKKLLTEEEIKKLPKRIKEIGNLPLFISSEEFEMLPKKLKTKGNERYKGKFTDQKRINLGASPGARMSINGIYYTKQRKYKPNELEIINYLREWRKKKGVSTKKIDKLLGYKYTAGHWFRTDKGGRSLPSAEDWVKLKEILKFDDKFDKIMTETHYTLQGFNRNPLGKNPGDMWQINTGTLKEAHFAVFPEELPKRVIEATCPENGIVLDPFAGSGTTAKVSKELGRRSIMIDINSKYNKIMEKRCGKIKIL